MLPGSGPGSGDDDASPWSTGPLVREASGPLMYFPMVYSRAEEVSAFVAHLPWNMGSTAMALSGTYFAVRHVIRRAFR